MRVPLALIPVEDKLLIFRNKKATSVDMPFKPFCLVQADKFTDIKTSSTETFTKVPENEQRDYLRLNFPTTKAALDFKRNNLERAQFMFINSYVEQLFISQPDFLLDYPNDDDLTVMFWDIETGSRGDGLFTRPAFNPVVCIGWSTWVYRSDGSKQKLEHKVIKGYVKKTEDDTAILREFVNDIADKDPDIMAGYNVNEFDWPYIFERCKIKKVDIKPISRSDREPYMRENDVNIPGRINFDIYNSNAGSIKDQSLFGIKSRTLKDLARWYKIPRTSLVEGEWKESKMEDIELQEDIENILGLFERDPEKLYAYQNDDVYRTEGVGHVYIRNCITLAEMMHVPLNNIMNMYSSFVPKLFVGRNMEKLRLINTESNFSKYNVLNGTKAKIGSKYEGALTGLYQDDFFETSYKVDFTSMYPSAIQSFNLGPDTTSLVSVEEYTGHFNCVVDGSYNFYRIPTKFEDGKYAYDLIVKIRNDREGFLKKEIKRLRSERDVIKKEMKTCQPGQKDALNSQQIAIKVLLNCFHPDTEILTDRGIRLLKDVKVGEKVWSINPKTLEPELKRVEKTYEYDITEQDLYSIKHQRFTQMVTEGHKMLGYKNGSPFFEEAKDFTKRNRVKIPKQNNIDVSTLWICLLDFVDPNDYDLIVRHDEDLRTLKAKFREMSFKKAPNIKGASYITDYEYNDIEQLIDRNYTVLARHKRSPLCAAVPVRVLTRTFSEFIGWYLSEGSLYTSIRKGYKDTVRGVTNKITISQDNVNSEYKEEIKDIITGMLDEGLKCSVYENDKVLSFSSDLYSEIIDRHIGRKKNKHVSKKMMSVLNLNETLDAMYKGDGTKHQRRYTISCKNRRLFNSYIEMLIRCGRTFSYYTDSGCYRIVDKETDVTLKKRNTTVSKYTGKVYSLTVADNHTVYAGLEGRMGWIGQSIYGMLGLKSSTYGEMISAAMVTGTCRWITGKVIRRYRDNLIELDTDGLILQDRVDIDELNKWLNREVKDTFNIDENYMQMELEEFGRSFFYATKNYVVQHGDDYIIHGSSLKSSKFANIIDRATVLARQCIFNNKPVEEVISEAYDFKGMTIDDFSQKIKLTKPPGDYNDQFDWRIYLARQIEAKTQQVMTQGVQMPYVVTKDPLPYKEFSEYQRGGWNYTFIRYVESIDELDMTYYTDLIDKHLAKFGIKNVQQTNLFGGDEKGGRGPLSRKKPLDVVPMDKI